MRATVDGALARTVELEEALGSAQPTRLRLAPALAKLHGPDKYAVLAHRRHQAQIRARRVLGLSGNPGVAPND